MNWPDIRGAYDIVAADYAAAFADELDHKPFDRDLLDRYALDRAGRGPVWDIGCGPAGHVTRYLADRGVEATGVDLSRNVVKVARDRQPGLEFRVADMRALPTTNGSLAGIVAFYSVIHLPRPEIPTALAEFRRALMPDGEGTLLLAMHGRTEGSDFAGDQTTQDEWFGHAVSVAATFVDPQELAELVTAAGFAIVEQTAREPYDTELRTTRLYVLARTT